MAFSSSTRFSRPERQEFFWSALSASDQTSLDNERVELLARAASINTVFELPKLLELLEKRGLIQVSKRGVDVLGVTTSLVVQHAAGVYDDLGP